MSRRKQKKNERLATKFPDLFNPRSSGPSIYPPTHLPLTIHLSIPYYSSAINPLSIQPSVHLPTPYHSSSINPLSIQPSTHLFIYPSLTTHHPSVNPLSIQTSTHLFIYLSPLIIQPATIHLATYLSTHHLYIHSSINLSTLGPSRSLLKYHLPGEPSLKHS